MSSIEDICNVCGNSVKKRGNFCPYCGANFKQVNEKDILSTKVIEESNVFSGFKTTIKAVSDKAKKLTDKTTMIDLGEKTSQVVSETRDKMVGGISAEKASEIVSNLAGVMIQIARDLIQKIPPEDIKAIDLEAEVSFVAFSVGVSIDLEQLNTKTAHT